MSAAPPSSVVTVLFTDIEGSTRLWEQDRERMAEALARHDALARTAVESNRGTVVKMTGDGVFAVFGDPTDALDAVVAMQSGLPQQDANGGLALTVRFGLHAGIVERRDNDWFGPPVNRAARIMATAHGGQVLLSQAIVLLIRDRLPAGTVLRDLGSVRLRDLTAPEHVYQFVHPGGRQDFPALRSLEATPNNLPQQVTSFIGRDQQLRDAVRLLENSRLLTILGPGGIGKTRLSLQVAADVLESFADGVWFIELASIVDPALVPKAVAQALGLHEDGGTPIVETVRAYFASRQLLLVLDNCEHLIDACAQLTETLLHAAPQTRVLASSREPLNVSGEQTYALPPLALPDAESVVHLTARSEAVQLFVERARLRQPDFSVTQANSRSVAQLCARLDGIPLALELAAARIGVLSVDKIAERLNDRFRLLTGGRRTALPRQQTLRALIDWSYDLLSDAEKMLFERLSVFAGGWSLDAAEIVGAEPGIAQDQVLDLLTSLVHKSLVVPDGQGERYRMLETLRDYARDRLRERGDTARMRTQHRDHFLAIAEQAEPNLEGGPEQPAWLVRLDQEHDNLRSALAWSLEAPDDAEAALRISGSIYRYWAHRGHAREGLEWCEAALANTVGAPRTHARAKAMHAAGTLVWRLGDIVAARSWLERALELSRELGDRQREGRILSNLGGVAIHQADSAAARTFLEQAAALHRMLGNATLEARVSNNLVALALHENRLADAEAPLERALELSRALGNRMEEATAMSHRGYILQRSGELEEAQSLHEHALAIAQEFGIREFELEEVRHLGEIALARGDLGAALGHFRRALATSDELGNRHEIALCIEAMAPVAAQMGAHRQAAVFLGAVDALRETIATPRAHQEQALYESTLSTCRDALGQATAATAIAEGRALPADTAVSNAIAWHDATMVQKRKFAIVR